MKTYIETIKTYKKDLDDYSVFFLKELKTQKYIDSDLYSEFIRLYANTLFHDFSLSTDVFTLCDYCQNYYNHHFSNYSMSRSETISALHSAFWLYFITSDLKKEQSSTEELATKLNSGHGKQILMLISSNPGIIHKKLAKESGITPSALSQFASKYQQYKLFSTIAAGREKAYFIESNGKQLLDKLDSRQENSDTLHVTIANISSETDTSDSRISELEAQLKEASQKVRELEEKLAESTQMYDSLKKQLQDSKRTPEQDKEPSLPIVKAVTSIKNDHSCVEEDIQLEKVSYKRGPVHNLPNIKDNVYDSKITISFSNTNVSDFSCQKSFFDTAKPMAKFLKNLFATNDFQDNYFNINQSQMECEETSSGPYQIRELFASM